MPASTPTSPRPPRVVPLDPAEERAWRAVARAMIVLPRVLESELEAEHRLTMAEYVVLVNLSEEPEQALRMTDLADRAALSLSGMTRVVDRLVRQGLVERTKCPSDARGSYARLTDGGLAKLREAYVTHLRGVREHVMDHLRGVDLAEFAECMERITGRCPAGADADAAPEVRRALL
ncbi:MAG TPA: MarR family transcriptional regulator [Acidimicrobiales bacterium]|nr:MarR family transcriptional regulator [Acidimicrobiales bacterium]